MINHLNIFPCAHWYLGSSHVKFLSIFDIFFLIGASWWDHMTIVLQLYMLVQVLWEGLSFLHSSRKKSIVTSSKITDTWDLATVCLIAISCLPAVSPEKGQNLQKTYLVQASAVPQPLARGTAPAGLLPQGAGLLPGWSMGRPQAWKLLTPAAKPRCPIFDTLKMDCLSFKKIECTLCIMCKKVLSDAQQIYSPFCDLSFHYFNTTFYFIFLF